MKRSTLALITAGMILGGAGVVEVIGTDTAAYAPPQERNTPAQIQPAPESSLADVFENNYPNTSWWDTARAEPIAPEGNEPQPLGEPSELPRSSLR